MTTLHYTCHLAASFMQKHHGIAFEADNLTVSNAAAFNAKRGDVVMLANGMEAYRYSTPARLDKGERILMRNGLAFIWPQSKD